MTILRDVELELAGVLNTAGLTGVSFGAGNLFAGPMNTDAGLAIAVRESSGETEMFIADAHGLLSTTVQVLVRGTEGSYQTTRQLAIAAWEALWLPAGGVAGYVVVRSQGTGPVSLGPNPNGEFVFVFDVVATYEAQRP